MIACNKIAENTNKTQIDKPPDVGQIVLKYPAKEDIYIPSFAGNSIKGLLISLYSNDPIQRAKSAREVGIRTRDYIEVNESSISIPFLIELIADNTALKITYEGRGGMGFESTTPGEEAGSALRKLTKQQIKNDKEAWKKWWSKNKEKYITDWKNEEKRPWKYNQPTDIINEKIIRYW